VATATAGTLSVTISAIDLFSGPLKRIGGNVQQTKRQFDAAFRPISFGARAVARNLNAIVPPLALITGAGTIAGMYQLTNAWARMGADVGRGASRTRTAVREYQALQNAARLAGASAEDMATGLQGLGDTVTDALGGRNQDALRFAQQLGIRLRDDVTGQARAAAEVLPELADQIERLRGNPALQARVMNVFSLPPGMLPLLTQGGSRLRELRREAERLGVTNGQGAQAAREFETAQTRLNLAGETLSRTIGERVGPVMTPFLNDMSTWATDRAPGIAEGIKTVGTEFAAIAFPRGFITELEETTRDIGTWIRTIREFADSPIGRWWFDRNDAATPSGTPWSLMGPVGRLPTPPAGGPFGMGDAAQRQRQRSEGGDVEETAGGWIRRHWNNLLNSGRRSQRRLDQRSELPPPQDMLALVGQAEGTDRGRGYNETLGYGRFTGGDRNLTGMTLAEVDRMQSEMLRHPENNLNSSAAGRYQITQTTLRGLVRELGLDPENTRFDQATQDRLATALMQRRGLGDYQAGRISAADFQGRLAQEWASIPDPRTGQGYYANQRRPGVDQGTLDRVLSTERTPRPPVPERGEEPMANPSLAGGQQNRAVVELRFTNPPPGLTAVTRNGDGGVRIERPSVGM
jgi:muramidase (phage lysozyme)